MPAGAPLIDFLAVSSMCTVSGNYPGQEHIEKLRENRGLGYYMLDQVQVVEIIVGRASPADITKAHLWMLDRLGEDL